ncbi:MAG: hypothetical protein PVG99_14455, partial [Desulfobacteraceae bacterium]
MKTLKEQREEAELKKIQLEIAQITKPWWKKTAAIIPLVLGLGTLVTGILTGWFENEYKLIELKREKLEREKQELRQLELTNQITLRLDMLFKDKELCNPGNPASAAIIALIKSDKENREFYTRLLSDHLIIEDNLTKRLMILYILHQGTVQTHSLKAQRPGSEVMSQPGYQPEKLSVSTSKWTEQFFELVEKNWERSELDRIVELGDWQTYDPLVFKKWIELIARDVDQIGDRRLPALRCIARSYYRTLPDHPVEWGLPDEEMIKAWYVYSRVAAVEMSLTSQEIFGYLGAPGYLIERKHPVLARFSRVLNHISRLDEDLVITAVAMLLHQTKIGPGKVRQKLFESIKMLFANLHPGVHKKFENIAFP